MGVQVTQVKVTLPDQLYGYVQAQAGRFGLTVSTYIRHLVLDDVRGGDLPVYQMSPRTEKVALEALDEHRQGKTKKIGDMDELIESL
ncbi:MAG: hypothetical protein A2784_04925 [Candidatus Chisholmbacteria bacterium RIFCSPHIGHO2_01_FULL_48_12]|uniref:Antitoxin n=1 Tax=Candidatus Chisholmbacteria bacterium RIFCSPHIGHO2_01_FULL_48_12 TaxID=1797589 RepID=A0A1G1VRF8_9BACT|nr:MAG: hypothetical protein A2784_04925 [Candidatus Chisholmbacteria bacterium RIFCSPHIGHO2_01_FULL_48_12]